jgi:hypothetical protein
MKTVLKGAKIALMICMTGVGALGAGYLTGFILARIMGWV